MDTTILTKLMRLPLHAVQQPLGKAIFVRFIAFNRLVGGTAVSLEGEIKIHGKSTIKIDLIAEWIEPLDLPPTHDNPSCPVIKNCKSHATDVIVSDLSGKSLLLSSSGQYIGRYDPATDIISFRGPKHELGDTKHRIVRYRVIAASRFKEYFDSQGSLDFTRVSEEITLNVLSSARPSPPKLLYVLPTYGWER